MTETDILDTALESLEKITTAKTKVMKTKPLKNGFEWDALISIKSGQLNEKFKVEIKRTVQLARLHILEPLKKENGLLVAQSISSKSKEVLKQLGINYLDGAGNCFIRTDGGLFWHISGKKPLPTIRNTKDKAFSKNGIKLVFALLLEPKMINAPYREWAEIANISVGTVGDILKDLKEQKYIVHKNDKVIELHKKKELLEKWVTSYNERLKPKLFRGKFRFVKGSEGWKKLSLPPFSYWGGEPAGDLLTNYLHPGIWTIYSELARSMLIKDAMLIPDGQNGSIEIYTPFWNGIFVKNYKERLKITDQQIVHPLLAYADLIGSQNDRNLETAKKIYEQYLQNLFE